MNANLFLHMTNDLAWKDKWGSIFGKFKIFDHMLEWRLLGYELAWQHFTPFATTFQQDPLPLKFMGKKPMFSPLHIRDLMQDSNNIGHPTKTLGFIVDEPIYFSGSGLWTKWVFCELKIAGDLKEKCQSLIKLQAYKP